MFLLKGTLDSSQHRSDNKNSLCFGQRASSTEGNAGLVPARINHKIDKLDNFPAQRLTSQYI
jgi:hypothetical protein